MRNMFLEHSITEEHLLQVKKSQDIVQVALSYFKKPYIAYSGGKDSTVLLHLILPLKKNIDVLHWNYGSYLIPRDLEQQVIKNARECGALNMVVMTSKLYEKLGRNLNNVWGKEFMEKELPQLARQGFDCSFIGLRAEESKRRKSRTQNAISHDTCMANVFPLKDWTWKDVYAYLLSNNVPYLKEHYDRYAQLLGYEKARYVTFFDPDFKHLGSDNVDGVLMWKFKNYRGDNNV